MSNKRYDSKLKARWDKLGKQLAQEIMRDYLGARLVAENVKEDAGIFTDGFWDQQYRMANGVLRKVEPEMKDEKFWRRPQNAVWDEPFGYGEMDIPYRKEKNLADIHIVISTSETRAFIVTRAAMDKCLKESGGEPKFKKTIYEPDGADYFSTPIKMGRFVVKSANGKWRPWKLQSQPQGRA